MSWPVSLSYVIAALQRIDPHIGASTLPLLQASPLPISSVLTTLLNDIAKHSNTIMLVLDDYHAVDSQPVDEALTFLLDNLPPQLHLVITSREDPNLPLARPAGARIAHGAAGGRFALYGGGNGRFPAASHEAEPDRGPNRCPGSPHRRLDCRAANGGALHAKPGQQ